MTSRLHVLHRLHGPIPGDARRVGARTDRPTSPAGRAVLARRRARGRLLLGRGVADERVLLAAVDRNSDSIHILACSYVAAHLGMMRELTR